MADKILHKRSLTTGSIPTTASLEPGEIALNVPDGKIYIHKSGSTGQSIESAVTSNSTSSIGVLTMSGSLILSGSTSVNSGSVFDVSADNISFDFDSLSFSGSVEVTGSLITTAGITASLFGTASWANNAVTASFVQTAQTASYVLNAVSSSFATSASFALTASYVAGASNITASSLTIPSGSITITTGSITMPNRPAFRVTGAGGAKVAITTLSGSYLNVDYQQGSGWDNSTGTFTAPIAGLYQVNLITRTNSNSLGTISQLIVYKNNTGGVTGTPQIMVEFGANTTMNHAGGSTISKLEVGDTLKMVVAVGEISFDANDNFSVAYIG